MRSQFLVHLEHYAVDIYLQGERAPRKECHQFPFPLLALPRKLEDLKTESNKSWGLVRYMA